MSSLGVVHKAGGVVVFAGTQKLAIVTNEFGQHVLPKGGIETGESYEHVARREVYEETGLSNLKLVRKLGVLERPGHASAMSKHIDVVKQIHLFLFSTTNTKLVPVKRASIAASWVTAKDLANGMTWPEELHFIVQHCPELFIES